MTNKPRPYAARKRQHADLAASIGVKSEDDLFDVLESLQVAPLILILDGIQDPQNLGACLRTAEAAGVHAVVAPKDRAVSLTETVRRVAAGAAERIPFIQVTNLARTMKQIQEAGLWIVGTADKAKDCLYDIKLVGPLAIVVGAEGKGVRRLTAETCDHLVNIPMAGGVECLNVAVATGVCLFEAVRQRRGC